MSQIIDRRLNGKNKSTDNRRRFIERYKKQIKKAVDESVKKKSISDIDKSENIKIPIHDTSEPIFHHDKGGKNTIIHPGNKEFITGDTFDRPPIGEGEGSGSQASNEGEGLDEFGFELSREEFLDLVFDELELPDLLKKEMVKLPQWQYEKTGHSVVGSANNLDLVRSFRQALGRRIGLSGSIRKKIREIEEKINNTTKEEEKSALIEECSRLKIRLQSLTFIDPIDLRYHHRSKIEKPSSQAVMICIMDVSGSMDSEKKDIAKRFFILLYLFLNRNYKHIELVFVRHHTEAKEVNEHDFFYSRETGGTIVSSALDLTHQIIQERFPQNQWNVYVAQASDGDNWATDSPICGDILIKKILPLVQYFAYVEILPRYHQSLWETYQGLTEEFRHFSMKKIDGINEIYPVFRDLFKKRVT